MHHHIHLIYWRKKSGNIKGRKNKCNFVGRFWRSLMNSVTTMRRFKLLKCLSCRCVKFQINLNQKSFQRYKPEHIAVSSVTFLLSLNQKNSNVCVGSWLRLYQAAGKFRSGFIPYSWFAFGNFWIWPSITVKVVITVFEFQVLNVGHKNEGWIIIQHASAQTWVSSWMAHRIYSGELKCFLIHCLKNRNEL